VRNLIACEELRAVNIGAGAKPIYRIAFEDLRDWTRSRTVGLKPQQRT
jgi:hypothetical protein